MMEEELAALKRILISLVVSSPTTMTINSLVKDYRNMVGGMLPVSKFGYRDCVTFIRERCQDIFVVEGSSRDPILTPKVTKNLKHIDQMVQKQKVQSSIKHKGKRRSVPGAVNPPMNGAPRRNLVSETFLGNEVRPPPNNWNKTPVYRERTPVHSTEPKVAPRRETNVPNSLLIETTKHNGYNHEEKVSPCNFNRNEDKENLNNSNERTSSALSKFYKKRLPRYTSEMDIQGNDADVSSKGSNDSGTHSSSSCGSSKLEEMKNEIVELIRDSAEGVWFTDLMGLYKERYGRELILHRFGHTSLGTLVGSLQDRVTMTRPDPLGDYLLRDPASAAAAAEAERGRSVALPPMRRSARLVSTRELSTNPDEALPGIEVDADVYPADCLHYLERIAPVDISSLTGGSQLELLVGEVYSPSHFWVQQVGPEYNLAMEAVMDSMNVHYGSDKRVLVPGAVRVGQYCASLYDNDWHRSLIVQVVDSDTVKVRHVDYGTVETVATSFLRYLPRQFSELPAQAVRARLAGCRPSARGQRWPHAAAADFLRAVRDKRLFASIVAVDHEEDILETFLTETSGGTDFCLTQELVRLGHADLRTDSALARDESYLYPRFDALETASTPNYAEIRRLLDDGIQLEFVDAYRRYVPTQGAAPVAPPTPPAPVMELVNRVPLLRLESTPPPAPEKLDLSPAPQFLPSPSLSHQPTQPSLPHFQNTQPQYHAAEPQHQMTQLQYQTNQPQYQSVQDFLAQFQKPLAQPSLSRYQTSQPPVSQYQTTQSQYQTSQPWISQYQTTQSQYQTSQPPVSQYQTTQSQYQTSQPPISQYQTTQSQYLTSQPPISQYQKTQSQNQMSQSQYQSEQALYPQFQTPQSPHAQYPTSQPQPSQVQTTQSAIFRRLSQAQATLSPSSQYRPTHSQVQSKFSRLQARSEQNSLSQLQSVQPRSTIQTMHPSLQQSQISHPSPRSLPQTTRAHTMQRPLHSPLAQSQAAQASSPRPFILPNLPVRPHLPTRPPQPTFMPTPAAQSSPISPLAQPCQPTAPLVSPPLESTQPPLSCASVQPPRSSSPSQPLLPSTLRRPPGLTISNVVPPPAPYELCLTEEEWSVLEHLRALDPAAAQWFLTVTASRAINEANHVPLPRISRVDSTSALPGGGNSHFDK